MKPIWNGSLAGWALAGTVRATTAAAIVVMVNIRRILLLISLKREDPAVVISDFRGMKQRASIGSARTQSAMRRKTGADLAAERPDPPAHPLLPPSRERPSRYRRRWHRRPARYCGHAEPCARVVFPRWPALVTRPCSGRGTQRRPLLPALARSSSAGSSAKGVRAGG